MERLSKYSEKEKLLSVIKQVKTGCPLIIFDLETTGLSKISDRILSFSAIKARFDRYHFIETDRMDIFINPGFPIPEEVTAINHITDEMVADCDDEDDAVLAISDFIGEHAILSGYNCDQFDIPFLDNTYQRATGDNLPMTESLDVMKLAKEKLNLKDYHLETVAHECGCDIGLTFHNSMDDVIATLRVLNVLISDYCSDKQENHSNDLELTGYQFFKKSAKVNRLYIKTYPYTNTYYDFYRGEWISDMSRINMKKIRNSVLQMLNVSDEKELARLSRKHQKENKYA